ncbi:MAG: WecB/TagA/CpsF family glycosyltransferase [Bacteroidales bacterium]|nr:WecB/TagA/CpsF family glycosyltransferase [Bacteroidales bacterium]
MSLNLKDINILESQAELANLPKGKLLINTINAHSYNTSQKDALLAKALTAGVLIPDGASVVKACRWLGAKSQPRERCAGWDLFAFEMQSLEEEAIESATRIVRTGDGDEDGLYITCDPNAKPKTVMFMGSSEKVLSLIREKAAVEYPHLNVVTYSPPFKSEFSDEDNRAIIDAINAAQPDLLWIGMTASKQEKWTYSHWDELHINCHVGTIGAVFDFFAGTSQRAPLWWQRHGLEWLYRLIKEPRRMWRRYVIGNPLFLWNVLKERLS